MHVWRPSLRGALATKQSILSLRCEMDCFAALAMTLREFARKRAVIVRSRTIECTHTSLHVVARSSCDEAIQLSFFFLLRRWIASSQGLLAMTVQYPCHIHTRH